MDRIRLESRPERANLASIRVAGTNHTGQIMEETESRLHEWSRVVGGRGWEMWLGVGEGLEKKFCRGRVRRGETVAAKRVGCVGLWP